MTPSELATVVNSSSQEERADFNDHSDHTVHDSGGPGNTNGLDWASIHSNYGSEEKAAFAAALVNHGLSVKGPC